MSNTAKQALWKDVPIIGRIVEEHTADKAANTRANYMRSMNEFIEFCCERWSCQPEEIDFAKSTAIQMGDHVIYAPIQTDVIESFLAQIPHPTNRSIANQVLYVIFGYLLEEGILLKHPVPKAIGQVWNPKQGLSYEQIVELVHCVRGMREPYRTAFVIALSAGLRVGELCALRKSDIELIEENQWTISICREALKGRRAWKLPLPDVSQVIDSYLQWRDSYGISSEYLFTNKKGKPMNSLGAYRQLLNVKIKGLRRNITPHDLRRAYATLMDMFVENPDVIVQAMRHSVEYIGSQRVTRGYVRGPKIEDASRYTMPLPVVQLAESLARLMLTTK